MPTITGTFAGITKIVLYLMPSGITYIVHYEQGDRPVGGLCTSPRRLRGWEVSRMTRALTEEVVERTLPHAADYQVLWRRDEAEGGR
jgi:hypothetical protein